MEKHNVLRSGHRLSNWMSRPGRSRGQVLIEVLIGLLIFGLISTAFMSGIFTSRTTSEVVSEQVAAESLLRVEMEYVKETPYWGLGFSYEVPGTPPPWDSGRTDLGTAYAGYSVSVSGTPVDASSHDPLPSGLDQGMQLIEVQVFRSGEPLLTTATLKINR
jgi:type II secretory pathway pseudopilin PulG